MPSNLTVHRIRPPRPVQFRLVAARAGLKEPSTTVKRTIRILAGWLVDDLSGSLRDVVRHSVGGSSLLPRVLRFGVYRAAGIRTATANVFPHLTVTGPGRNLTIGAHTYINRECHFDLTAPVTIGEDCLVGMRVLITTSDHERGRDGFDIAQTGRPVVIGDRVWLGAQCILLPGVTVGDDVIVAAGAVVTRDCRSAGIYAGVPARRIKDLGEHPDTVSSGVADGPRFADGG